MTDVEIANDENTETLAAMTSASLEMREQNRCFGIGLIFSLLSFACFVFLTTDYKSFRELPIDIHDEDVGRIGNDITNPHTSRDNSNNPFATARHKGYDSFYDNPSQRGKVTDEVMLSRQKDVWKAWSHAHPNQTLPKSLNWSQWNPFYTSHPPYPIVPPRIDPHSNLPSKRTPLSDSPAKMIDHDQEATEKESAFNASSSSSSSSSSLISSIQRGEGNWTELKELNNTQITENKTTTTVLDEKTKAEQVMNQEKELEDEDLATDDKNTTTDLEDIQQAWNNATVTLKSGVKFQIIDRIPHDPDAFTQGLTYVNGKLFESTGLYGRSSVRILDPQTGKVQQMVNMKREYFGEGMTVYKDKLVQIVWKKAKGFVYDLNDLTATPIAYTYETTKFNEGWGITYDYDRDRLIVTDGSSNLIFWEPDCWQPEKQSHCAPKSDPLPVIRQNGQPAMELNEIEYWRGRVLANVWYSDVLLVINPETGQVEKEYDFRTLFSERNSGADVFNGISISDDPDVIYVTGKLWSTIFKVKLLI